VRMPIHGAGCVDAGSVVRSVQGEEAVMMGELGVLQFKLGWGRGAKRDCDALFGRYECGGSGVDAAIERPEGGAELAEEPAEYA